jgi:hypothetical protein
MDHFKRDIRDWGPLALRIKAAACNQNVKVGIVVASASSRLKNNNGSEVELLYLCAELKDVLKTSMTCAHQGGEKLGVVKKPRAEEFRSSQNDMPIGDAWQEPSTDKVNPMLGVGLRTGKTEGRFASKSDTACFTTVEANVLDEPHFLRVTAIEHFLDHGVIIRRVELWITALEGFPMVAKDLLEGRLVDVLPGGFHRACILILCRTPQLIKRALWKNLWVSYEDVG